MGVKLASELFPRALLQRLRSESKDDLWSSSVKRLTSRIAGDYAEAEEHLMESRSAHSSQPSMCISVRKFTLFLRFHSLLGRFAKNRVIL